MLQLDPLGQCMNACTQQLQATATVAGRAGQVVQASEQQNNQQDNTPTWVPDTLAERSGCARTVPEPTEELQSLEKQ
jgi:hypothetical protein